MIIKLSSTQRINNKEYCIYCCKEAHEKIDYGRPHNGDSDIYYYSCNCEMAKNEIEMNEEIKKVKAKYKLVENTKGLENIKYNHELKQLNQRYNIK